ncbi:MAG TPA: DUF4350 domain-containing protein [Steroidobacteraceae bacterium]|nr:DUF4350 domain-containing protein [Steroidobacteraceae bacterium]
MNARRWITLVLVVAVAALVFWIGSHLRFEQTTIPLPLKGEAIKNPFYAATKFAEHLGAKGEWERVLTLPPTDSVMLLSNWNWSLSRTRRERIENWVREGGRLVVDDSLLGGAAEFEKWSGIGSLEARDDDEDTSDDASEATRGDAGDATTDEDVESADDADSESIADAEDADEAKKSARQERKRRLNRQEREIIEQFSRGDCLELTEDDTRRGYSVCDVDMSRSLTSSRKLQWALRRDRQIHALRVAVGRGSVTVLNASPFRFREFLQGDHAKLFLAVTQLHHGDGVYFFTEEDHASLLTLVWRFGAPAVLLLAALIALALWRNTTRFGPLAAAPEKARRSLAEQIRGTGLFTLRFGNGRALHAAMVRALREAALKRLPHYDRLSAEERVAAIAALSGVLASELGPAMNFSGARTAHEMRNVIAVLETARRRLSITKKAQR